MVVLSPTLGGTDSGAIADNSTKQFILADHIKDITDMYNTRNHSSLYDDKGKRDYSPQQFIERQAHWRHLKLP